MNRWRKLWMPTFFLTLLLCVGGCGKSDKEPEPTDSDAAAGGDGGVILQGLEAGAKPPTCSADQTPCGGSCVDLKTSHDNCGGCGKKCGAEELCVGGSCQPQGGDCRTAAKCPKGYYCSLNDGKCRPGCGTDEDCGLGGKCNTIDHSCCSAGLASCSGTCVDLSKDPKNCGKCGNTCPAPPGTVPICSNSTCKVGCTSGKSLCGYEGEGNQFCVDLTSDANHCGQCYKECYAPTGGKALCNKGSCASTCSDPSQTSCDGQCVDTTSDVNNCGGCGKACPTDYSGTASCENSQCKLTCQSPYTACNGKCVDLKTDTANCGFCGKACASGDGYYYACSYGQCATKATCTWYSCGISCCSKKYATGKCCWTAGGLGCC